MSAQIAWVTPEQTRGHLLIDGFRVPYVEMIKHMSPSEDGMISLCVDGRFSIEFSDLEELSKWGWALANAMAIAAGYSCFGENSQPLNRFGCKAHFIGDIEP